MNVKVQIARFKPSRSPAIQEPRRPAILHARNDLLARVCGREDEEFVTVGESFEVQEARLLAYLEANE